MAWSSKYICRVNSVRLILLAVPSVWMLTIVWTMYMTQGIQNKHHRENHMVEHKQPSSVLPPAATHVNDNLQLLAEADSRLRKVPSDDDFGLQHKFLQNIAADNNGVSQETKRDDYKQPVHYMHKTHADQMETHILQDVARNKHSVLLFHPVTTPISDHYEYVPDGLNLTKKFIIPGVRFDHPKLGEYGLPVKIELSDLSEAERLKYEKGWRSHEYNEYVSALISTQREVPDNRNEGCKQKVYSQNLPKVSIIICFYNEAWSVLIRTIHSILTRSPAHLITEILLVDDFSDMVDMKKKLENYVAQIAKIRLIRMNKRSGLVRARLAGVKEASGPVLLFLDSHVECAKGWLEPLLQVIAINPKAAVTPEIDVIDDKTFAIQASVGNIGILDFKTFSFDWALTMPRLKVLRKSEADPIMSPTMAGGLFAIRKDFFLELGTYDVGLELWGGENIELSLKLWMCGGGILIHPCSRVAHIFRDTSPYLKGENSNVLVKNSARVAQVWADDFKIFFFKEPYDEEKYGSVKERMELRERLQCHDFSWYIHNVYPEIYIKGSGKYLGKIQSKSGLCINKLNGNSETPLILTDCQDAIIWEYTGIKEIRDSTMCLDYLNEYLVYLPCNLETSSQTFEYTKNDFIYHPSTNTCLTESIDGTTITFQKCSFVDKQKWTWFKNHNYIPTLKNS